MPTSADTVLRLACDGSDGSTTFTDLSSSGLTVTAVGNAQVDTAQSKWGGASLQLDGTDDYLSIASTTEFGFGTGPWTAEGWVRRTASNSTQTLFDFRTGVAANHARLYLADWRLAYFGASTVRGGSGATVPLNTWTHVAWCYDGTTLRAFMNGTQQWAVAFTPNFSTTRALTIGADYAGSNTFAGHIDDIRVSAAAWYTTDFVAPLTPLETMFVEARAQAAGPLGVARVMGPDALSDPLYNDVSVLLHFDGANNATTFVDDSSFASDISSSNPSEVKLTTAESAFGPSSLTNNSSGVSFAAGQTAVGDKYTFGTGDFTVEGRVKLSAAARGATVYLIQSRMTFGGGEWAVRATTDNKLQWQWVTMAGAIGTVTTTAALPTGSWASWAVCRKAGVLYLFIDGAVVLTVANTTDLTPNGYDSVVGLDLAFAANGTLYDEFRVTKGVGRYTTDYTPRTAAFLEGPPQPEALVAADSPLGAPAVLATVNPAIVFALTDGSTTTFGDANTATFFSAASTGPGTTFGSAAHEPDRSAGATSIAPSTSIGEAQAVRGIPLLPPGQTKWLAPSTTFGLAALQAVSYNSAAADSAATVLPTPRARLRQPAVGFAAANFGAAASALSARAAGGATTAFGTPSVASLRSASGALFGAFGSPSTRARGTGAASGWAATSFGLASAAAAARRTRSSVFRQTFGRAQAERTAP